jgi:signal transduction histidine kinase
MSIAIIPRRDDGWIAHWREAGPRAHMVQYRVLQETLTNVHRHSGASEARVSILEDAEQVILEVKDNGRGIPEKLLRQFHATGAGMGVGLAGIRERAWELGGKLEVESDGSGTLVRVTVPLSPMVQHEPQTRSGPVA